MHTKKNIHYSAIRSNIISWYHLHKRLLPWRGIRDPYQIWVAEIIMQQTRIRQGTEYYQRFLEKFPDIFSLSEALEDELLSIWQGLGYYSRARNMHQTARTIVQKFDGKFPDSYKELIKLKGIGEYTSAIILSICYNKSYPSLDGNVSRLLSRLFGISEKINHTAGKKIFLKFAGTLMDKDYPGDFNEALMDLGSMVCTPLTPDCASCPLTEFCYAYKNNKISQFPVKKIKSPLKIRYLNFFLIESGDKIVLTRREENDIWKNLYQLPLIESDHSGIIEEKEIEKKFNLKIKETKHLLSIKHILTHQKLLINFYSIGLNPGHGIPGEWQTVRKNRINEFPLPKPVENFVSKFKSLHG